MAAELIRIEFLCQLRLFKSRIASLRGEKKRKVIQKDILRSQQAIFKQLQREFSLFFPNLTFNFNCYVPIPG